MLEAAALAQFREQVAREYVSREAMRELEERVVKAIDRVGDRLDRIIAPVTKGMVLAQVRPTHPVDPCEGEAALIVRDPR